ncbi:MAG: PhzF family phenazine biosynthesis protein [Pseudomonadota bacterium]
MASYAFDWVDAFTDTAFGGNGCVVVHGADGLAVADRLALVRETSLSECAYLVASDVADFGARYYLADREIPFAGHPTIATVVSLLQRGLVAPGQSFSLETGAGVFPIRIEAGADRPLIVMTQRAPEFGPVQDRGEIAAMYGLGPEALAADPDIVSTGTAFCVALLRDKDAQRRAVLDTQRLAQWRAGLGDARAAVMEPFLVTLGGATAQGDVFSRLLLPPPLPPEDPFTGSATGCMAAYLWAKGLIDRPDFVAEQGHWMGRPGQAQVRVLGPRDAITGVEVAGTGVVVMDGRLTV